MKLSCKWCEGEFETTMPNASWCSYDCTRGAERVRQRANRAVYKAIRECDLPSLKLEQVACVDCGKRAQCYDHRDYLLPLSVDAVCWCCNRRRGTGKNVRAAA